MRICGSPTARTRPDTGLSRCSPTMEPSRTAQMMGNNTIADIPIFIVWSPIRIAMSEMETLSPKEITQCRRCMAGPAGEAPLWLVDGSTTGSECEGFWVILYTNQGFLCC